MANFSFVEETRAQIAKKKEAARRILEIAAELHLTMEEYEDAAIYVKKIAYISSGSESVSNS